jgi:hypothetical protein
MAPTEEKRMRVMRRASQLVLISLLAAACSSPGAHVPAPAADGPTTAVDPIVAAPVVAAPAVAPAIVAPAVTTATEPVSGPISRGHGTKSVLRRAATTQAATTQAVTTAGVRWKRVFSANFNSGGVPSSMFRYNGPYGSGPKNCASPSHTYVKGGWLRLRMQWESSGKCGAGWYTGGVMVGDADGGVDQKIALRFRVVRNGASSHFIIPMRWPTKASWPAAGEEDLCETDSTSFCHSFLHYSSSNQQVYRKHSFNMSQWHTVKFVRANHKVQVFIDNMKTPRWTYNGSESTLPSTFKRVVLQQECNASGCPSGRSGAEEIQITWMTIDTAY